MVALGIEGLEDLSMCASRKEVELPGVGSAHTTETLVRRALHGVQRTAPIDLICFSADSAGWFIRGSGEVQVQFEDLEWVRLQG